MSAFDVWFQYFLFCVCIRGFADFGVDDSETKRNCNVKSSIFGDFFVKFLQIFYFSYNTKNNNFYENSGF